MTKAFSMLHPLVKDALEKKGFYSQTLPQERGIPAIMKGRNVVIIARTGSGKTESALLPIFSKILSLKEPKKGIKAIYVAPLRALNRDLLNRLKWWGEELGIEVQVRHGDTTQYERRKQMLPYRRKMTIIYQDPFGSLDPRMTVGDIISEPMEVHKLYGKEERENKVMEITELVGLTSEQVSRYPHEFSGGQRQRIGIARSLALDPEFIVADEPVSALDVSIQAQIVNLLHDLQKELDLTYLFIAHDLAVVKHICERIAVMYLGKVVEIADKKELFRNPMHPYTKALMSAVPIPNPHRRTEQIILTGDVPSPVNPPPGCHFHNRCPSAMERCSVEEPELVEVEKDHFVSCHLY
jgi:oligopeptide/dipeptide ABC transporter ATP-binding protein